MPWQVLNLAWPLMAHMLLSTLVFVVGRAMLGQHNPVSLGSMQISGPLLWSLQSVLTAFSVGTLALVGHSQGAGDAPMAAAVTRISLKLAVGLGVCVSWPLMVVLPALLDVMFPDAGQPVRDAAVLYMRPVLFTMPLSFVEAVAAAALQGSGDTRTPMRAGIAANVVHVALGPVLLFGWAGFPNLGVQGAGMAAAVALGLEGVLLLGALLRRGSPVPLRNAAVASRDAWVRLVRVSGPAVLEKVAYHVGFLSYVSLIGRLGPTVMAANQALVALESLCFLSAEGFGMAAGAMLPRRLGAGVPQAARSAGWWAAGLSAALLGVFGLMFAAGASTWLPLLTPEPAISAMAQDVAPLMIILEPVMGWAMVLTMGMRGAGATRMVLALTLVCAWFVRVTATWLFTQHFAWGLWGAWLGAAADWGARAAVATWMFRSGAWARTRV